MALSNTLAYYDMATITSVKSFTKAEFSVSEARESFKNAS
jgi:hypothetical protein